MGPFYNRTDKEGQQLFNEDDDDGVGFVAERSIDERDIDTDVAVVVIPNHIPIDSDTLDKVRVEPHVISKIYNWDGQTLCL
jgi:hypothetical protein